MTRVLSMERLVAAPPEWMMFAGAVMLAIGVAGAMWTVIKMIK